MNNIEIYYINTDNLTEFNLNFFSKYLKNKNFKSEKRKIQFCLGRFIAEKVLQTKGFKNFEILTKNNKPYIKNNPIYFSISHSNNIVLVAFADCEIGADIEFMKQRNFKELYRRLDIDTNDLSIENFYKFWTQYEAKIKLQQEPCTTHTIPFENNFMLSVSTALQSQITNIKELKID